MTGESNYNGKRPSHDEMCSDASKSPTRNEIYKGAVKSQKMLFYMMISIVAAILVLVFFGIIPPNIVALTSAPLLLGFVWFANKKQKIINRITQSQIAIDTDYQISPSDDINKELDVSGKISFLNLLNKLFSSKI